MTWDSAPLDDRLEILGAPVVELELAVDRPSAFVAVRLCDVAPDGASTRITFGVVNLTHRSGHEHPIAMEPGVRTKVRIALNDVAHALLPGHRLRVAISTDYWPMIWPSPEPVTLTVFGEGATLELPVRPPRAEDADLEDLGEPTWGPPAQVTELRPGRWDRVVQLDPVGGGASVENIVDGALTRLDDTGRALALTGFDRAAIGPDDPTSARATSRREFEIVRDGNTIRVATEVDLSCTAGTFILGVRMMATENDAPVWARDWDVEMPRDHV